VERPKLCVVQLSNLPASSNFFQWLLTVSFLFLLISLHLSHFFTFSLTLQLPSFLSTNTLCPSLSFPHNLIFSFQILSSKTLSLLNSLISMAPKSKKSSYVISSNVFNLTCWNRAMRLNESPLLTHWPHNDLSESARTELVSFSNLSHFLVFSLIFHFNMFLDM